MFGFKRRTKLGRLKVQLSDSAQGTRSPAITHAKRISNSKQGEGISTSVNNRSSESSNESTSTALEPNNSPGSSENWMVLSIAGDKPTPRFNHAATVIGNKMIVVGGESANGMLEDVQVLNFDRFSWTTASSKLYLSPTSLPLKIPACKGHTLVSWGKKVLLVGGKTDPASDKITVWAFDTETECWSLMEAKGDIPAARSGHTVVKASSVLILFGGEDSKRRKLNDLHMFDLKSSTWLPLNCTGSGPSPRCNHVATLYDDKLLLVFGGTSKSKTLNDLYSLDFEAMVWSRIKIRGVHPSARSGCCGVLCGTKWYIAGGGSRKKRHAETLTYDIEKQEWSVAVASPPSSITTNKGFSLVLVQHKERDFLVAFGGTKKEISNQVEVLIMEKNESPVSGGRVANSKLPGTLLFENRSSSAGLASKVHGAFAGAINAAGKQNLASAIEHHGSGRRSLSESLLVDGNNGSAGNVSFRNKFQGDEDSIVGKMAKGSEDGSPSQVLEQRAKQTDAAVPTNSAGGECTAEEASSASECESFNAQNKEEHINILPPNSDDVVVVLETDSKSGVSAPASITRLYETKIATLVKKNGMLEAQLAAALGSREAAEKNLSAVLKSRQEMEKKLADAGKEMEMLKEKLAEIEVAQEEANSLSNIVHSDNVRLEHDVAFLKAVLDDTQKELHSTRGVLAGEGARALQLQVEVLHLKQRLQSMENRAPTPRKPFHG